MKNIVKGLKGFKVQLQCICNRLKSPIDNMGSKTRLSSCCTKRGDKTVNLVISQKKETRDLRAL